MKYLSVALAVVFALSIALPSMAAPRLNGAAPSYVQLAADKEQDKDKAKAKKGKKDNDRSNKGGAERGKTRTKDVKEMNKEKKG